MQPDDVRYCERMQLAFDVGTAERHHVVFSFDKVWGRLLITVDGTSVVDQVRFASVSRTKTYEFIVGTHEQHAVRIEKRRAAFFAGFRPQPVTASVDGIVVATGVA